MSPITKPPFPLPTLLLLGLLLLAAGTGCGRQEGKTDDRRFAALGEVMAKATAQLLGGKGTAVLVVPEPDPSQPNPYDATLAAFRPALTAAGVQITGVETVKLPGFVMSGSAPFSAQKFSELMQKDAAADVLVSFIGAPILTADQLAQLPSPHPKVVSVATYNPPTRDLFAQKIFYLAAVPKPGADAAAPAPADPQACFDAGYQLVTPENAAVLLP